MRPSVLFLAVSFFCAASATQGQSDTAVPPVFHRWAEAQKNSGSIKVSFTQTRTSPALKEPAHATGRFWRLTDGRFRWELDPPAGTVLIFDQETVRLRENADAPWQTLNPDDHRVRMWMRFLSGRDMDMNSLTKNFTLRVTQQEKHYLTVAMVPRALLIKKYLRQLDMQITPEGTRLLGFRIVQGDGSTLLLNFGPPEKVRDDLKALFKS